jgi:hypothetical protein
MTTYGDDVVDDPKEASVARLTLLLVVIAVKLILISAMLGRETIEFVYAGL